MDYKKLVEDLRYYGRTPSTVFLCMDTCSKLCRDAADAIEALTGIVDTLTKERRTEKPDTLKIMLDEGAILPTRAHSDDAGLDLYSPEDRYIEAYNAAVIDTGVHVQIPRGFVGIIKSRSGLNIKHGITCEGVIDAGYTGSIKVRLANSSEETGYWIRRGDKIAQLVILPIVTPALEVVDRLEPTERGDSGFGSTGR